jgi:hypothetical protein
MHRLMADTYKAAFTKIDPGRLQNTFEVSISSLMIDL